MIHNTVTTGKFLSISDVTGALGLVDAASPATKMMVHQIKKDRYQLIHHNDVKNAVGFYGDGKVEEAGAVLAQTRAGTFYICVVSEVAAQWQADVTLVDPSKEAAATMIQAGFRGMKGRAAAAAAAVGGSKAPAPWPKEAREF